MKCRRSIKFTLIITLLISLLAIATSALSCQEGYSGPVETLTLGYTPSEASCLLYVAEDQGFFSANGVKMIEKTYSTGAEAIQALLKGEVDVAGMSETPFINQVFTKQSVSIYANLDKLEYTYLIVRKDRGIQTAADLKGKRIGLPQGTIAEFYLGRYLQLNGLSMKDVTVVNADPQASADLITKGNLDGVVIWNPIAYQIEQQVGDNAMVFHVQSGQAAYGLAVARSDWLTAHKELIERSLRAIAQAEQYMISHPAEAKAMVQKRLNYDTAYMDTVWSENQFSLSLDQSLVVALEDESRWLLGNNLTPEKSAPDFLKYIYPDALHAVKPDAVNIIR